MVDMININQVEVMVEVDMHVGGAGRIEEGWRYEIRNNESDIYVVYPNAWWWNGKLTNVLHKDTSLHKVIK